MAWFPEMNSDYGGTVQNHTSETTRTISQNSIFFLAAYHPPQLVGRHHGPHVSLQVIAQLLAATRFAAARLKPIPALRQGPPDSFCLRFIGQSSYFFGEFFNLSVFDV